VRLILQGTVCDKQSFRIRNATLHHFDEVLFHEEFVHAMGLKK